MIIREMNREECLAMLARTRLGRLACAREGQPYVVPFYFVHDRSTADEDYLYSFSAAGQKIEWMSANPLVCVELDEVASYDQWTSVIVFGHYEELTGQPDEESELRGVARQGAGSAYERHHAWQLLQAYPTWWQPSSSAHTQGDAPRTFNPVFYRIHVDRITGRRAVPSPGESIPSRTPSRAGEGPSWLGKVFHALAKPFAGQRRMKGSR
jgi:nitroimidazol reductase NimA-like FMN-containing flavoprotein (pyridoxamine 5'-phosphate oxidase superfamily)